jgi:phosphonate transport system substrate-binding protein
MHRSRLGLIPQHDGGDVRVRDFVEALSSTLETPIDIHQAADYRALVSALDQGLVQFAWLPPLSAARAVRSNSIVPAAIAVRHGATSYLTGLITLATSGIRTLADLRGLRAAWVDRESASGYVVIRAALRNAGVSLVDAFAEDIFVRSHSEVARALDSGRADVGATCFNVASGTVQMARVSYTSALGDPLQNVHIIAQAGPIASDIFAVHHRVPGPILSKIQQALVGARPINLFDAAKAMMFADAFARPDADHLRMLENLYDTVGNDARSLSPPPRTSSRPPPRM